MTSKVVLKFRVTTLPTRLLYVSLLLAASGCARWSPQETGQLWQGYPATPAVQSGPPTVQSGADGAIWYTECFPVLGNRTAWPE